MLEFILNFLTGCIIGVLSLVFFVFALTGLGHACEKIQRKIGKQTD